jgi:hypothetical protein
MVAEEDRRSAVLDWQHVRPGSWVKLVFTVG